jgi:hypothetical protein
MQKVKLICNFADFCHVKRICSWLDICRHMRISKCRHMRISKDNINEHRMAKLVDCIHIHIPFPYLFKQSATCNTCMINKKVTNLLDDPAAVNEMDIYTIQLC